MRSKQLMIALDMLRACFTYFLRFGVENVRPLSVSCQPEQHQKSSPGDLVLALRSDHIMHIRTHFEVVLLSRTSA